MISVIIPIYKTPLPLLSHCIDSILKQDESDFEVILIDDGSNQPELTAALKSYLSDERFTLLEHENKGVSYSRNCGIAAARGEYITFVDADDTLDPSFFSRALHVLHETGAEAVIGGIYMHEDAQTKKCTISSDKPLLFEGQSIEDVTSYMLSMCAVDGAKMLHGLRLRGPWGKLIRRDSMMDITFQTSMAVYEDTIFNVSVFRKLHKLAVDPALYYHYYIAEGSAMRQFRPNGLSEQETLASELLHVIELQPGLSSACGVFMLTGIKKLIRCTLYYPEYRAGDSAQKLRGFLDSEAIIRLLGAINPTHQKSLSLKDRVFLFLCKHSKHLLHLLVSSGVI